MRRKGPLLHRRTYPHSPSRRDLVAARLPVLALLHSPALHIVQNLAREKCDFSAFLFLKASSYRRLKPFSNIFGVTSRLVLTQQPTLDELAQLPVENLAAQLYELSDHHLPDPLDNARKLQRVAHESLLLDQSLTLPVQRILDLSLDHIRFLETQLKTLSLVPAAFVSPDDRHSRPFVNS